MLEMLLPEYIKQLLENYQNIYAQLASQFRWLYFDDSSRLVTRVGYLDDGYIRLRLEGHWEFTGELLREMSWLYYSVAEVSRNVDMLKNALESVGLDRLRVVAEVTLGELNLTRVGGTPLTARDWSQDFAKLQNIDVALSSFVGTPDTGPPGKGVVLLGYDGTYLRLIRVTSDGKLLAVLG
jgi:hypothetical protein